MLEFENAAISTAFLLARITDTFEKNGPGRNMKRLTFKNSPLASVEHVPIT